MSGSIAIIDATGHGPDVPLETEVAGLGLLERTLRLAEVSDCGRAVVWVSQAGRLEARRIVRRFERDERWEMQVEVRTSADGRVPVASPGHTADDREGVLFLDSTHVYERGLVEDCLSRAIERGGIWTTRLEGGTTPPLVASDHRGWSRLAEEARGGDCSVFELVFGDQAQARALNVRVLHADDSWVVEIDSETAADRAAASIWEGCYKSVDGPISRNLNRPISLSISRRLAPTNVRPNHMSAVTFAIGIGCALAAAVGGFWWFVLAGVLYQLTSILDGVDGELARGKYEFSLAGAWIDTLCDNFKDIIFYLGVGYGAYKTVPLGFDGSATEIWLWLGGLAAVGKLLSLAGYSVWMIPRGVGCPLYFDWGTEEKTETDEEGLVDQLVSTFEILSKNDVVLFGAFAMSLVGLLPWFLLFVAVGHQVVAASIANRLVELSQETDRQPETSAEPPETVA